MKWVEYEDFENKLKGNWPVVYVFGSDKSSKFYIGQSTNVKSRKGQHKNRVFGSSQLLVLEDKESNLSRTTHVESELISLAIGSGMKIENESLGIRNKEYSNRLTVSNKIPEIWNNLRKKLPMLKSYSEVLNEDMFKFSPYKSLNDQQEKYLDLIMFKLNECNGYQSWHIKGEAGTGKSILMTALIKELKVSREFKDSKILIWCPGDELTNAYKQMFSNLGYSDITVCGRYMVGVNFDKDYYDFVFVDEYHRLESGNSHVAQRKKWNEIWDKSGLPKKSHPDKLIKSLSRIASFAVFDENQILNENSIKVSESEFDVSLTKQMRSMGGTYFTNWFKGFLEGSRDKYVHTNDFQFEVFGDIHSLKANVEMHKNTRELSSLACGGICKYDQKSEYDFVFNKTKLKWGKDLESLDSLQGFELNYIGLIITDDLVMVNDEILINKEKNKLYRPKFIRKNGKNKDWNKCLEKVIRIYTMLANRGIHGCGLYVECDELREKMKSLI